MAEVMTQKQIDELLGNLQSGETDIKDIKDDDKGKQYKEYDFRTPKRITREQIKLLDSIFENFARLFALQISSLMRIGCEAELVSLDEYQYYEFGNALDDSVLIGAFNIAAEKDEDDKSYLMEISRPLSYGIIDRLLGGTCSVYDVDKEYTDIEVSIMEYIFQKCAQVFTSSWANYIDVASKYSKVETNSRLIQTIAQDETVIIAVVEVTVRALKEKINICIPLDTLNVMFKSFETKFARVSKKGDLQSRNKSREYIMDSLTQAPLTVKAELGTTEIRLKELLNLQIGDVIPLETPTNGNTIKVIVDNAPWFKGVMGVKQKKYAIKIGTILESEEKEKFKNETIDL
ncbi:MAG: flagellar motor switch protein FliM [Oscillospiraceae bacterium]